jgi:aspartyl-tRNA(Asn)/glutamyl-tRNA(Gln) amidotransferase subunit C
MVNSGGDSMSEITKEQVLHVAHLARLAITDEEAEKMTKELDAIIGYAELLNELDTDNVEPTTHVLDLKNVMREDEPRKWIDREDALKNAPDEKNGQFRVPSILD